MHVLAAFSSWAMETFMLVSNPCKRCSGGYTRSAASGESSRCAIAKRHAAATARPALRGRRAMKIGASTLGMGAQRTVGLAAFSRALRRFTRNAAVLQSALLITVGAERRRPARWRQKPRGIRSSVRQICSPRLQHERHLERRADGGRRTEACDETQFVYYRFVG